MKRVILSERNLVAVLFVLVLVFFTIAQQDTKKIEEIYFDRNDVTAQSPTNGASEAPKADVSTILPAIPTAHMR